MQQQTYEVRAVRLRKISMGTEMTLDLYFTETKCHICGKKLLCVIPDNSNAQSDTLSLPVCKTCVNGMFAEIEASIADPDHVPEIGSEGWDKTLDEKEGKVTYSRPRR